MDTHTTLQTVLTTSRGEPYRPANVVAARFHKDTSLRIVISTGEVLTDNYANEAAASGALARLHHAMSGIVDTHTGDLPFWATAENARIVCDAVLAAGGSRERAAQAFAHTLMGIGSPASCIDTEHMQTKWNAAFSSDLPVLILAGMPTPDHSDTKSPIVQYSPLARLTLLAVQDGVDPSRLIFAVPHAEKPMLGDSGDVDGVYTRPWFEHGCVYTIGERNMNTDGVVAPRKSFHWCMLNAAFFYTWMGIGSGPLVRVPDTSPIYVEYDGSDARQVQAMTALATYFQAQGWSDTADRLLADIGKQ